MQRSIVLVAMLGCVDVPSEPIAETAAVPERGTLRVRDWRDRVFDVEVENVNGLAVLEGDVSLGAFAKTRLRGFGPTDLLRRWPKNASGVYEIQYSFDAPPAGATSCNQFLIDSGSTDTCAPLDTAQRDAIRTALADYAQMTGIVFTETASPAIPYLVFRRYTGISMAHADAYGVQGGLSPMITFKMAFDVVGDPDRWHHTILHEVGHSLGLAHEFKRPDNAGVSEFFPICMTDPSSYSATNPTGHDYFSKYDTRSIMQYQSFSHSLTETCDPTMQTDCCPVQLDISGVGTAQTFTYVNPSATDEIPGGWFRGAWYAAIPPSGSQTFTGVVFATLQDKSFSDEDINTFHQMYPRKLETAETDDKLGSSSISGDFNGDGYKDLAVGAPGENAVFVYRGTYTGLAPWTVLAPSAATGDLFGAALAKGDLDNDGDDDLLVGAPNAQIGSVTPGAVYIYLGDRETLELGDSVFPSDIGATNGASDDFGAALDVADENGSLRVLAGAPGTASNQGRVYVLSWTSGTLTSTGQQFGGNQPAGAKFGTAIVSGKLDTDDYDDIVIGAPGVDPGKIVFVKGGASLTIAGSIAKPGTNTSAAEKFGTNLKLGAFRNTAKKLVVVSAPFEGTGVVYVMDVNLTAMSVTATYTQTLSNTGASEYGAEIAVGDFDGDGDADLAIGSPGTNASAGQVNKLLATGAASGNAINTASWSTSQPSTHGTPGADHFGASITIADFNDDGMKDVAITAPNKLVGTAARAGAIWVQRGQGSLPGWANDDQVFTQYLDEEWQPQK